MMFAKSLRLPTYEPPRLSAMQSSLRSPPKAVEMPAWRPNRIKLVGERIRAGMPFWEALDGVPGAKTALADKIKRHDSVFRQWKVRGVPRKLVRDLAGILNVPPELLPRCMTDRECLHEVGRRLAAGIPFSTAIYGHMEALSRQTGVAKSSAVCWMHRGFPHYRVAAVARLLCCDTALLPISAASGDNNRTRASRDAKGLFQPKMELTR